MPSNEGRGYVLRRILRRGIRHAYTLGSSEPLFHKIFDELKNLMGDFFQELNSGAETIKETLYNEEIKFRETLSKGLEILGQEIPNIKNNKLDGKIAFKLYDTFGFPLDLTQDYLRSKDIDVDLESFDASMKLQKRKLDLHGRVAVMEILKSYGLILQEKRNQQYLKDTMKLL